VISLIGPKMASTALKSTMRAVVLHTPGGPSALKLQTVPVPTPKSGEVLIRVHAFGLNRSEMYTRQGLSPSVKFPRILGIEASGTVASAPGGEFAPGTKVATIMGGMGRDFDGGYAEYVLVPAGQVKAFKLKPAIEGKVGWEILGAVPELCQTAYGAVMGALKLQAGETILVRGGTSSVGLMACEIAKWKGAHAVATTRKVEREGLLRTCGAEDVIVDTGEIAQEAKKRYPEGFDKVFDLVGCSALVDSMKNLKKGGIACMAGAVGNKWSFDEFTPNMVIPNSSYLTVYGSTPEALFETPLDEIVEMVYNGTMHIPIRTYRMDQIVEAHQAMDDSTAGAKIVVLVD